MSFESASRLLRVQDDDYSCGPACLATVFALFNALELDGTYYDEEHYHRVRSMLNPDPDIGTTPQDMLKAAWSLGLPVSGFGSGAAVGHPDKVVIMLGRSWDGVTRASPKTVDHYQVSFLRHGAASTHFDPEPNERGGKDIFTEAVRHMDWTSGFWPDDPEVNTEFAIVFNFSACAFLNALCGEAPKPFMIVPPQYSLVRH